MRYRWTIAKRLAAAWLLALLATALFADFLANDRPLIARIDGETRFPVLHEYGETLGLTSPYQPVIRNWKRAAPDWAWWPPVPYAAGATDLRNSGFRSPFAEQDTGERARHYLGTDDLGRDLLAGLISGSRVAIAVGLGSLLVAFLIGIPLGGIAGFFGNSGLRGSRARWWGGGVGGGLGLGYALICLRPFWGLNGGFAILLTALLCALAFGLLFTALLRLIPGFRRRVSLPADTIILQIIEVFLSVPGLVLLITLLVLVERPSVGLVAAIIGLLSWPTVARYLRGELLRIRSLPYIDAARVSGIPLWRILFHHALPNALGPLIVVACFSFGAAILAEAALSFLGLGVPAEQISWGSLLNQSRTRPDAWWLAVFPGIALSGTVLAGNILGSR